MSLADTSLLNTFAGEQVTPVVSLRDLAFSWSRSTPPLLVIPHLNIAAGERVFLYGPSGSGKTTLLNLLAGISIPQAGKLQVLQQDLTLMSQRQRDKFRAHHIGIIFQQFNLIPYLNVLDNVLLGAHFAGIASSSMNQRARQLLDDLGLARELFQRPARRLSVGQQQRVAVARALVAQPEILIADEPTSALDSDSRDAFMQLLLKSATEAGCTIIFVSHDKSLQPYFSRSIDIRRLLTNSDGAGKDSANQQEAAC